MPMHNSSCPCTSSQRKFARETPDAKRDTFKRFREWLDDTYTGGNPSDEEWETIAQEDQEYTYTAHSDEDGGHDPSVDDNTLQGNHFADPTELQFDTYNEEIPYHSAYQ